MNRAEIAIQRGFNFGYYEAFSHKKFGKRTTSGKNFKVVKRCSMTSFGTMCLNIAWIEVACFVPVRVETPK